MPVSQPIEFSNTSTSVTTQPETSLTVTSENYSSENHISNTALLEELGEETHTPSPYPEISTVNITPNDFTSSSEGEPNSASTPTSSVPSTAEQVTSQSTEYSALRTEPIAPPTTLDEPSNTKVHIGVDPTISTNTPITDAQRGSVRDWAEQIRECLASRPNLSLVQDNFSSGTRTVTPILFDGQPGNIVRNLNGRLVCSSRNYSISQPFDGPIPTRPDRPTSSISRRDFDPDNSPSRSSNQIGA